MESASLFFLVFVFSFPKCEEGLQMESKNWIMNEFLGLDYVRYFQKVYIY